MNHSTSPLADHLADAPPADQAGASVGDFEAGMIVAWNAFARWSERCMAAAGAPGLTTVEIILLNHLASQGRDKKLADICFALNFSDTHVVSYGLKKLVSLKLAVTSKHGKEVLYSLAADGQAVAQAYTGICATCLMPCVDPALPDRLDTSARSLRQMSLNYDQAARLAGSM